MIERKMNETSGANKSYWVESTEPMIYDRLQGDAHADAAIVGAGIAGLTVGAELARRGHKVIIIDDGFVGSGESGRTTAHLSNALDDRYYYLEGMVGEDGAKALAESHTAAIDYIERNVRELGIECDFVRLPGYLFLHRSDTRETLDKELASTQKLGLRTTMKKRVPGIEIESGDYIEFPNQATFHPMKYYRGLAKFITDKGGKIYTETRAEDITKDGVTLQGGGVIHADHYVVATNTPVNNRFVIHTKQAPYRTYVIAAYVPKGSLPTALWWDTGDHNTPWTNYPYHYVRLQEFDKQNDLLIIGGEDHKTGQPMEEDLPENARYLELEKWARKRFPMMGEIVHTWSGQVQEPVDGVAFIGKNPGDENIYVVTGDSGNGMTHCSIAGMLIPDLIENKENPWAKVYDPDRVTASAAMDFIKEQVNVAKQFGDYFTGSEINNYKELLKGEGAIVRSGLTKVAVYRDEDGTLRAYTAICPHLKCVVQWNRTEKTFDCPCHGSRFTSSGKMLNGPAISDLEPVDIPDLPGKDG